MKPRKEISSDFDKTISNLEMWAEQYDQKAKEWIHVQPEMAETYQKFSNKNSRLAIVLEKIGSNKKDQITFIQKALKLDPSNNVIAKNLHLLSSQKEIINAISVVIEKLPDETVDRFFPKK